MPVILWCEREPETYPAVALFWIAIFTVGYPATS
jgi:hypothetical protein